MASLPRAFLTAVASLHSVGLRQHHEPRYLACALIGGKSRYFEILILRSTLKRVHLYLKGLASLRLSAPAHV